MSPTTIHVRLTGVTDQTTPGIETRDLARLFRRSPALAGVSVRVEAGARWPCSGPTGRARRPSCASGHGSPALVRVGGGGRHRRRRAAGDPPPGGVAHPRHRAVRRPERRGKPRRRPAADPRPGPRGAGPRRARAGGPRRGTGCAGRPLLGRHAAPLGAGTDPARPPASRAPRRAVRGPRCGWPDPGRRVCSTSGARSGPPCWSRPTPPSVWRRGWTTGCASTTACWPRWAAPVYRANRRDGSDRPGAGVGAPAGGGAPVTAMPTTLAVAGVIATRTCAPSAGSPGGDLDPVPWLAVTMLIFGFALGPDQDRLVAAGPGLLWLAVILSGMAALGRLHHLETEDGAFEVHRPVPHQPGRDCTSARLSAASWPCSPWARSSCRSPSSCSGSISRRQGPALGLVIGLGAVGVAAVGTLYAGLPRCGSGPVRSSSAPPAPGPRPAPAGFGQRDGHAPGRGSVREAAGWLHCWWAMTWPCCWPAA